MENRIFKEKSSNFHSRTDRFILPRSEIEELRNQTFWRTNDPQETVEVWNVKHQQRKKFAAYLSQTLGFNVPYGSNNSRNEQWELQPWPCVPRKGTYLTQADMILDLPQYNLSFYPDVLDWSRSNLLVASLGNRYYFFSWREQAVVGWGASYSFINCCKFSPEGHLLLLGTISDRLELHDVESCKRASAERDIYCRSYHRGLSCSITTVDWSPTGNSFVVGCTTGDVSAFDRTGGHVHRWRSKMKSIVTVVRVSPDTRYVAVAFATSSTIDILTWPDLKPVSTLETNGLVKSLQWHPWRSALLAVGVQTEDSTIKIEMLNAASNRCKSVALGHATLESMLFSHRTGELVLSLWNAADSEEPAHIVVMSDPNTVQECRGLIDDHRVLTMIFSPDGTKLATVTTAEDLIIWNFLNEDKKKDPRPRRFSSLPEHLDLTTQGFAVR